MDHTIQGSAFLNLNQFSRINPFDFSASNKLRLSSKKTLVTARKNLKGEVPKNPNPKVQGLSVLTCLQAH